MKCTETKNLLSEYIDRELTPALRREVEGHIQGCAACHAEFQEMSRVWGAVKELPFVEPEAGYVSRFWTKAASKVSWQEGCVAFVRNILRSKRFIPAATALSLMVIVGSFNLMQVQSVNRDLGQVASEDVELLENMDLAEHLDVVKDLDFLQDMDVIQDLDSLKT